MADQKEEVVLDLRIDGQAAEKDLIKIEKSILGTKAAMQELSKAYKAGQVTTDEFIQENIRLQAVQKKEQEQKKVLVKLIEAESNSINALTERNKQLRKERNNLDLTTDKGIKKLNALNKAIDANDKAIQKNVSLLEKQRLNIGNYVSALDVLIPGTANLAASASSLTGALQGTIKAVQATGASLQTLNAIPILALVNGLVAAYQIYNSILADHKSKIDEVAAAQKEYSNRLIESQAIIDGFYKEFLDQMKEQYALLDKSIQKTDLLANRIKRLAGIRAEEAKSDTIPLQQRLALLTESLSLYEKDAAARQKVINDFIRANQVLDENGNVFEQILTKDELALLQDQLNSITDTFKDSTDSIIQQILILRYVIDQTQRELNKPNVDLSPGNSLGVNVVTGSGLKDPAIEASNARIEQSIKELQTVEFTENQKRAYYRDSLAIRQQIDQAQFDSAESLLGGLTALAKQGSDEQKALALINIGVNTAEAIVTGIASSQDIPYPGNLIATATTIATILSNIAAAKQYLGFAQGGYTGSGYGSPDSSGFKPAGIVHEHEYVTPKRVVMMPQAQHHLSALEGLRTRGYADGGLVSGVVSTETDQAMMTANAIKDMPPGEVSVREITLAQKRIAAREKTAKLAS